MTDYTRTPDERPWSRDLAIGDRLTAKQAYVLQDHRLADFNIHLTPIANGTFRVARGSPQYTPLSALG